MRISGTAATASWSAGRSPHRKTCPGPPPPSLRTVCTSGTPESPIARWTAPNVADVTLASTTRHPARMSQRASDAPVTGLVASSAISSRTGRPCSPPSALSSSTAITARFSQATANTAPGPDLLVSRPIRYSSSSAGWQAGQPRRRSSHSTPRSSISALTLTLVDSAPAWSRRTRSRPRQGWSSAIMICRGGASDATLPRTSTAAWPTPTGRCSVTADPTASTSQSAAKTQPAPCGAPNRP